MKTKQQLVLTPLIPAVLSLFLLNGCDTVSSRHIGEQSMIEGASATYALPKSLVKITKAKGSQQYVVTTTAIADNDLVFTLDYSPSWLSDDKLEVAVDGKTSFLESVNATVTDQTAKVLEEVAKSAARASTGFGSFLSDSTVTDEIDISFDPHDPDELNAAKAQISRATNAAVRDIRCVGCGAKVATVPEKSDGIYVRAAKSIRIDLCSAACRSDTVVATTWVTSFNGSPLISIPVERSVAVARKTVLTFSAGAITKVEHDKPSEAAGVAGIPGAIISAIFSGLASGHADQEGVAAAEAKKLTAQASVIDAQAKLVTAKKALDDTVGATGDTLPRQ